MNKKKRFNQIFSDFYMKKINNINSKIGIILQETSSRKSLSKYEMKIRKICLKLLKMPSEE